MKKLFPLPCFALFCSAALAGCGASATPENSAPASQGAISNAPPATPAPTAPTARPVATATPTGEDERYRATSAEDAPFGPEDTPESIAIYKKYMKQVHQMRPPLATKVPDKVRVVMQTSRGPITLELDGKAAPLHVKSFLYLAGKGFYDGTVFHRHESLTPDGKGFIVQGGDPLTKIPAAAGLAGRGGPGYEIPRERNKLTHEKLVIAAARTQDPDSAGSQFYITQGAVPFLDKGDGYTVFGRVVAGQNVALKLTKGDKIQSVKVENSKKPQPAQTLPKPTAKP